MIVLFAIAFLILHAGLVALAGTHAMAVSYGFLIAASALACACAVRRAHISGYALDRGWSLMAASMLLWTVGMISSLRLDLFVANNNVAPGETMLFYVLSGVPIFYAVATVGVEAGSPTQRGIDAVLAITLGYLYFALMFSWISLQGASSPNAARMVVNMFDVENGCLAITAF
jgi:hypothetical protein